MAATQTVTVPGLGSIVLPADVLFEVALVPKGQTNQRPGDRFTGGSPSWYTQHETGNPRAGMGADAHKRYLHNGAPDGNGKPQQLSYHVTIDDRKIIVLVPFDEICWHAGDAGGPGNHDSLACELCVNIDADKARARRNAEAFAAAVTLKAGIPLANVVQHHKWSGKDCPMLMRRENYWPTFLANVKARREAGTPPPAPVPTPGEWVGGVVGMSEARARARFGEVPRGGLAPYRFDPTGRVTRLWIARGAAEGVWPQLVEVEVVGGDRWFVFSDDWTVYAPAGGAVRVLKAATAAKG